MFYHYAPLGLYKISQKFCGKTYTKMDNTEHHFRALMINAESDETFFRQQM